MSSFELSRNITIGQYLPTNSPVHRLDPRFKVISFVILVLVASYVYSYVGNALFLLFAVMILRFARIPLRYGLSGVRPAIPILVLFFFLELLLAQPSAGEPIWFHMGFIRLSPSGLRLALISILRFVEMVLFISALTLSTTLSDTTHAIERLLRPLGFLRIPVHEFAMIITIALRFVPTFAGEAEKLMKAQASRGAGFGTFRWWQIVQRTKSVVPIIVPLFVTSMRRAEELVSAMDTRCYVPGAPRTSYVEFHSSGRDVAVLLLCFCFAFLLLLIPKTL